jgi:hypothetical protein
MSRHEPRPMPKQAPLRIVKRWKRYRPKDEIHRVPRDTRGFYVLYSKGRGERYEVRYIGVSGLGKGGRVHRRLRSHRRKKDDWTHFSLFEVHDNITAAEIRELEAMLLEIFHHDPRIGLANVRTGSRAFSRLRREKLWKLQA